MSNLYQYLEQAQRDTQLYEMYVDLDEYMNANDIDERRALASSFDEFGLTWDESKDVFFGTMDAWKAYYNSEKAEHEHHVKWNRQYRETEEYKKKKQANDEHLKSKGLDWMIKQREAQVEKHEIFPLGNSFEEFFQEAKPYKG